MRLQDFNLLAWSIIVAGLLAVLTVANTVGTGQPLPAFGARHTAAVVSAQSSASAVTVQRLRQLAPAGIAAGADPVALGSFGRQLSALADTGMAQRHRDGAGDNDQLYATFAALSRHGRQLARVAGSDPVGAVSLRTRILLEVDRATALVAGMPVPATLPEPPGSPFGPDTTPLPPQAATPPAPHATPPGPATPQPHLNLTKPTPGDLR